jgi:hypothetical protein
MYISIPPFMMLMRSSSLSNSTVRTPRDCLHKNVYIYMCYETMYPYIYILRKDVCIYIYAFICMYIPTYIYIYIYIYMYIHTYRYTYIYVFIYIIYIFIYICIYIAKRCTYRYTYIYTYKYMYTLRVYLHT